jgi:hypothetical protein
MRASPFPYRHEKVRLFAKQTPVKLMLDDRAAKEAVSHAPLPTWMLRPKEYILEKPGMQMLPGAAVPTRITDATGMPNLYVEANGGCDQGGVGSTRAVSKSRKQSSINSAEHWQVSWHVSEPLQK